MADPQREVMYNTESVQKATPKHDSFVKAFHEIFPDFQTRILNNVTRVTRILNALRHGLVTQLTEQEVK